MEKINLQTGNLVVLTGINPQHWYVGNVKDVLSKDTFTFKVYTAFNENMANTTMYAHVNEIEYMESV